MSSYVLRLALACFGLALAASAQAQPSDAEIDTLIREGVAQFERGELGAARATFETVLAEKPDHVVAIYELAYTRLRLGEADRALSILDDALARNLPVTAEFFSLSASILDNLGRLEESLDRFSQGASAFPEHHNLRLNFGITQMRMGDTAAAKQSFERAIALQPMHPSAHYFLGQIYAGEGQLLPAILALGTSLGFDNQAQRMTTSATMIKTIMDRTIRFLDDGTPMVAVSLEFMTPPVTLFELSQGGVGYYYSTAYAMQRKLEGDLSYEPYVIAYAMLVGAFLDAEIDPASHFVADHYRRFYDPMAENGHTATFAHLILSPLNREVSAAWVAANGEGLAAFRDWTRTRAR